MFDDRRLDSDDRNLANSDARRPEPGDRSAVRYVRYFKISLENKNRDKNGTKLS